MQKNTPVRGVRRQAIDAVHAGPDAKPKKSSHRYVIEVRTAKGESLVLTTEWTKESRRYAVNQILRLEGFAKPALDESPKGHSLAAKRR
jgi:hypothetical protein